MVLDILEKAETGDILDKKEILRLFRPKNEDEFAKIIGAAFDTRMKNNRTVKLTSTIHITNICHVTPKCKYCGFAAGTSKNGYYKPFFKTDEEILEAALNIEASGIPRVSCSGAHGYNGRQAVKAAEIVKKNTSLELLVNVGSDLNAETLETLKDCGTDTVCCNLETTNRELFNNLKPGERLEERIDACRMISESGIELSSGLLIGIGESYEDRLNHLTFLQTIEGLGEIPIMGFNPYEGTPMENHPACTLREQVLTIAITRILFPEIRITVPTPTIGTDNIRYSLLAGADNLATVIPADYPLDIKGVGSPSFGTLNEALTVIDKVGMKPQFKRIKAPKIKIISIGQVIQHH